MFDSYDTPLRVGAMTDWYGRVESLAERGREDLLALVSRFLEDWSTEYGFRVEKEIESRIKSQARIEEKCSEKGVEIVGAETLLVVGGPVGDILGVKLVVRTLTDLDALCEGLQENFDLELAVDDMVGAPTATGYRAMHFNGVLPVTIRNERYELPFEIQAKTLAQDAWGYYTHDSVYARRRLSEDARFSSIRALQKVLADQLHAVDMLQKELERLAQDATEQVQLQPSDIGILGMPAVMNLVNEEFGFVPTIGQADTILTELEKRNLTKPVTVRRLLRRDTTAVENVADSFRQQHSGRSPAPFELLLELIREYKVVLSEAGMTSEDDTGDQ